MRCSKRQLKSASILPLTYIRQGCRERLIGRCTSPIAVGMYGVISRSYRPRCSSIRIQQRSPKTPSQGRIAPQDGLLQYEDDAEIFRDSQNGQTSQAKRAEQTRANPCLGKSRTAALPHTLTNDMISSKIFLYFFFRWHNNLIQHAKYDLLSLTVKEHINEQNVRPELALAVAGTVSILFHHSHLDSHPSS